MSDSIEQKVIDIVVEQLNVTPDQVKSESKFIDDLGADSLDTVELVMAFEEEFGVGDDGDGGKAVNDSGAGFGDGAAEGDGGVVA